MSFEICRLGRVTENREAHPRYWGAGQPSPRASLTTRPTHAQRLECPLFPNGKAQSISAPGILPFGWSQPARLYSHLQVPALAPGVEISPAGSILVRHQGSWQATQHGNHIVMDGASCVVALQELGAVFHTKNNSTWSNGDLKAWAAPSGGQCGPEKAELSGSQNPTCVAPPNGPPEVKPSKQSCL